MLLQQGEGCIVVGVSDFRCPGRGPTQVWIVALITVFSCPCLMLGQRSAGHNRRPLICVHDCSNSAYETTSDDDLKSFNQVMALQGTPEQSATLLSLVHELQLAKGQLQALRGISGKSSAPQKTSDTIAALDQPIAKIRTQTQSFLASFSAAQKSGLKDLSKKVEDADSELGKQLAALEEVASHSKTAYEQLADCAANVDKTLANVEEGQLALAREMGIILPSTELTFNLAATNSVNVGASVVSIPVSGIISRTSSADGQDVFAATFVADLSDLQDRITDILRSQVAQSPLCGERIELRQAMLIREAPASRVFTRIHVERWICPPGERGEPTEVAAGEGSLELKLMPLIERDRKVGLNAQISHVDGNDFVRDSLLGEAGHVLKDKITASLVSVVQEAADFKLLLPSKAQQSAIMNKAEFQHAGARLALVLDGGLELSDQQTQEFASEIRQRFSAQQISSP